MEIGGRAHGGRCIYKVRRTPRVKTSARPAAFSCARSFSVRLSFSRPLKRAKLPRACQYPLLPRACFLLPLLKMLRCERCDIARPFSISVHGASDRRNPTRPRRPTSPCTEPSSACIRRGPAPLAAAADTRPCQIYQVLRPRHLPSRAGGRSPARPWRHRRRPPPPPHLLSLSQGREGNGRDPAARGGSAQIHSRRSGPPSLEVVHGGPTRLQPWTETPETLATRGGPTPTSKERTRASCRPSPATSDHGARASFPCLVGFFMPLLVIPFLSFPLFSVQVARIWTSCCSYCFRWTRTSPPSWLLRLPTPSSYPLAWCGELHPLPCTSHLLIANGLDTTWWCLLMCTYPSSLNVCAIKLLVILCLFCQI